MWKVCGWCWISLSLCSMLWRRSSMKENVLSSSMINWGVDSIQWYAYWMLKWLIDHIQVRRHVEGMGSEEDSVLRWWWHSNIRLMTMTHNYHHIPINRQPCIEICSILLWVIWFFVLLRWCWQDLTLPCHSSPGAPYEPFFLASRA